MTKTEKANQKRLDNATKASSMTLKAQLNALNTDAGYKLKSTDKEGKVTEYAITKREHLEQNLGMAPHYSKNGQCLGYTPATFYAAVDENLKDVSPISGKTIGVYVYVDRVVTVTIEGENGPKDYSLYTSEEADKKVKGESAQACKLYRKVVVSDNGWGPNLIVNILRQSRQINEEIDKAAKSAEKFAAQKAQGLYIVKNVDGVLKKFEANLHYINE